jgi:F-type H+-transporting ATPase subunit epsilon
MNQLQLEIITPDRPVLKIEGVSQIVATSIEGEFAVLPNHAHFLTLVGIGRCSYDKDNERHFLAVSHGYAEVRANRMVILARAAEKAENIDVPRAEKALEKARELLGGEQGKMDFELLRVKLLRALTRIKVAGMKR